MKTSAATSNADAGRSRVGKVVVALQMALCVVLLVCGGLLIRTLQNLRNIPLGMKTEGLVVFGVNPQSPRSAAVEIGFYQELQRRLRALPGVEVGDVDGESDWGGVVKQQYCREWMAKRPSRRAATIRIWRAAIILGPIFSIRWACRS